MKLKHFPELPSDWILESDHFASSKDSTGLFLNLWRKRTPKHRRALFIVHGFGEHGGRYEHAAHFLDSTVDFIGAVDYRGHGRSQGLRGHTSQFQNYVDDVRSGLIRFKSRLEQWTPHFEIHLLGHSMGGLISFLLGQQDDSLPLRSMSLSTPLLKLKMPVPPVKEFAARLIRPILGSIQMTNEIDSAWLTHDTELNSFYRADQLNHNKVTPQCFLEMNEAMEKASCYSGEFPYPVQFQIPTDDAINDPAHAQQVFAQLKLRSGVDKQLATYAGFFHESYNEIGKEKPFGDLERWILKHSLQA